VAAQLSAVEAEAEAERGSSSSSSSSSSGQQTERCLRAIEAALAESGLGWTDALFVSLYVADMAEFALVSDKFRAVVEAFCGTGRGSASGSAIPINLYRA
jgi:diphthine-ammonia ligase